jgi:hypothetical protein
MPRVKARAWIRREGFPPHTGGAYVAWVELGPGRLLPFRYDGALSAVVEGDNAEDILETLESHAIMWEAA